MAKDLKNKVIAREYVEQNYIKKDNIIKSIRKMKRYADFTGMDWDTVTILNKLEKDLLGE